MAHAQRTDLANLPATMVAQFDAPLRSIAARTVRTWFNRARLDEVLCEVRTAFPDCELVYALDIGGRQMSSNIYPDEIDTSKYWQDLSQRPITVPLRALSDTGLCGAFFCDPYISQVTARSCVTVMYGVRSDASLLGFIAADFDAEALVSGASQ